jgi:hypothetical protein
MQAASYATDRRVQRVSATIPISLMLQPEESEIKHDGWIVDISANGARVRSALVLSSGQVVGVIASETSEQPSLYRVVWVQQSSAGCVAGLARLGTI